MDADPVRQSMVHEGLSTTRQPLIRQIEQIEPADNGSTDEVKFLRREPAAYRYADIEGAFSHCGQSGM